MSKLNLLDSIMIAMVSENVKAFFGVLFLLGIVVSAVALKRVRAEKPPAQPRAVFGKKSTLMYLS